MRLDGSCHCGKVGFRVESDTPYPFMFCYCSICRKTAGGPYGCNIMGKRDTLRVTGKRWLRAFHAIVRGPGRRPYRSGGTRSFCTRCGTQLFVLDQRWPEGVWPNAAVIDTKLPTPRSRVHIMTHFKPAWVPIAGRGPRYRGYPKLSIAEWHERHRSRRGRR